MSDHSTIQRVVEGKPPTTLNAGEVFFVPAETIHAAKNVGSANAAELATYVVEKGKPLVEWAPEGDRKRLQGERPEHGSDAA